jgi:hypothetical protein
MPISNHYFYRRHYFVLKQFIRIKTKICVPAARWLEIKQKDVCRISQKTATLPLLPVIPPNPVIFFATSTFLIKGNKAQRQNRDIVVPTN